MPEFEWDDIKDIKNWWKHGIWFGDASLVWDDVGKLVIPAKTVDGEPRFTLIGRHGNRSIAIIYTPRGAKIRIISARAARRKERQQYAAHNHHR